MSQSHKVKKIAILALSTGLIFGCGKRHHANVDQEATEEKKKEFSLAKCYSSTSSYKHKKDYNLISNKYFFINAKENNLNIIEKIKLSNQENEQESETIYKSEVYSYTKKDNRFKIQELTDWDYSDNYDHIFNLFGERITKDLVNDKINIYDFSLPKATDKKMAVQLVSNTKLTATIDEKGKPVVTFTKEKSSVCRKTIKELGIKLKTNDNDRDDQDDDHDDEWKPGKKDK